MAKILIVDDDADLVQVVASFLRKENHVVEIAHNADDGRHLLSSCEYDVVVLDWSLPDGSGVDILKWYRKAGSAPVIMLTGKAAIAHKEEGLDAGADDYLTKPFSMKELSARIRALLRRPPIVNAGLSAGSYILQPSSLTVKKGKTEIRLPPREFALLEFLFRHPQEVFKSDVLMARVWRSDSEATTDSLRTAVKQIRRKLEDDTIIETIPGAGYKLGNL